MDEYRKTKKFERSLKIIKDMDHISFMELAYQKTYGIINSYDDIRERLDVWVPIFYRLAMVDNALFICNSFSKHMYEYDYQHLNNYYDMIDADSILNSSILATLSSLEKCGIVPKKWHSRKKSIFSIVKKGIPATQCLDLLGIEFYIEYSDFFSDKLCNFVSLLASQSKVLKVLDFLSNGFDYKYIPIIDIIIQKRNIPLQIKIKCFGFEKAELGVNYFEYKGYNIDSIKLDDKSRLLKILYFNDLENCGNGSIITKILFNEIHGDNYLHLNFETFKNIEYKEYLDDISNHSQRKIGQII